MDYALSSAGKEGGLSASGGAGIGLPLLRLPKKIGSGQKRRKSKIDNEAALYSSTQATKSILKEELRRQSFPEFFLAPVISIRNENRSKKNATFTSPTKVRRNSLHARTKANSCSAVDIRSRRCLSLRMSLLHQHEQDKDRTKSLTAMLAAFDWENLSECSSNNSNDDDEDEAVILPH